ncbi:unnamed protein product [Mycena citricolor]|uniref:DUF6699 domain-containing protein n=1 Tax=Mycena citricolor TaxID=2018698 RepID=A0AAD2K526_9AGAR|nr:unnamed protein product [Mycena citricolor]
MDASPPEHRPNVTPFIPPLQSPHPTPPTAPPIPVPPPAGPNTQYPSWAVNPQGAAFYPGYPNSPYTAQPGSTPYIPFNAGAHTGGALAGGYFPPTPGTGMGMGMGGGLPGGGGFAMSWGSGVGGPGGTPWPAVQPGLASPYPPAGSFIPPGPYGGGVVPPPPAPQSWANTPPAPPAAPPWAGPPPGMNPWGAHMPMWNGAPAAMHPGMFSGMGPPMAGLPGGYPMAGPGAPGLGFSPGESHPYSRGMEPQGGDQIDHFMEGPHYGPVLEPFLVRAVKAHPVVNPLLQPPQESTDRVYLKWNMLFASGQCQRSDDPPHMSWAKDRGQPATFPRVTSLRLISETFPWPINISARNREIGVTCGDVIDQMARDMSSMIPQAEYEKAASRAKQTQINNAYRHNRSRAIGVPGGQLNQGLLHLDWLCEFTMYGGIRDNERLVKQICGEVMPCTFELVCVRRYQMTAEEHRNQEALQRTLDEQQRTSRRTSHRPTVHSVRDEDSDTLTSSESESEEDESGHRSRSRRGHSRPGTAA